MRYVVIILKELILDSDIDMDVITGVIHVKVIAIKCYCYWGHLKWVLLIPKSLLKIVIELKVITGEFMDYGCFSLVQIGTVHDNVDICI